IKYIKSCFFSEESYINKLSAIIEETISEHEKKFPYRKKGFEIPFYHSQIIFNELNKYIIFENNITIDKLKLAFNNNNNVIVPSDKELTEFYESFIKKVNE